MRKNVFQYRQFCIDQTHSGMKVGTDSDLLGTMAMGGTRMLDIGTGTGVIALMMAQRYLESQITAIEIDDNAVIDATANFAASPWANRIQLVHDSFQHYLEDVKNVMKLESGAEPGTDYLRSENELYDSIVCNPPYFDKSLECPDTSRLRARHTSSLPFDVLIGGTYQLLKEGGYFSVCIPPEVLDLFLGIAAKKGFCLYENNQIKALPDNAPKRFVLIFRKQNSKNDELEPKVHTFVMRNADHTYSDWYINQLRPFLTGKIYDL